MNKKKKEKIKDSKCAYCPSTKDLTIDHIIPQIFFEIVGLPGAGDHPKNMQTLCSKCNGEKGHGIDLSNDDQYKMTLKIIEYVRQNGRLFQ